MSLSEQEIAICKYVGVSEEMYLAEKTRLALPPATGLSADELKIANALGITPEQYAEAKRLAG